MTNDCIILTCKICSFRLYVAAKVVSFRRSHHKQYMHTNVLMLRNVATRKDARFYVGKRVAYLYKGKNEAKTGGLKSYKGNRVIWGKILAPHGNSGAVRAKFAKNLPTTALGRPARVFLYPSNI